ncbi:MAG TPA: hypothetical protein VM143_04990 [Acidimicrobiales bacterium]|nr:hypothetical protein [Acidimicrobiales bacterium]
MTARSRRMFALRLLLPATLALAGACSNDRGGEGARSTTTSSTVVGSNGATSAPGGATTTTAEAGGPTTTGRPAGGEATPPGVIELSIVGGNVEGGVRRETVKQGSQVTLRVTSDVADELHLHSYELKVDLVPGQSADLTFLAKIPGVFEVELENHDKKVLELEVKP